MKIRSILLFLVVFAFVIPAQSQPFQPLDTNDLVPITPQNAHQMTQLQVYGQGLPGEVAWSPDGKTLAVADSIGVWFYSADDWTKSPDLIATFDTIEMRWDAPWGSLVEFSPDGQILAFSNDETAIRLWDVEQKIELPPLTQHSFTKSIAFSPDGLWFVAGGGTQLTFWKTDTWEVEKRWMWSSPSTDDYVRFEAVTFSPDGSLLATSGNGQASLWLWDPTADNTEDAALAKLGETGYSDTVFDIAFSSDSQTVVSASLIFGAVRAFDVHTFEEIALNTQGGAAIAFSPDGQLLATAWTGVPHPGPYTGPTTVDIFDVKTQQPVFIWEGHESVRFLDFDPRGVYLAAVSALDGRVRVLDVRENTTVGVVHTALFANNLSVSPNSQQLALDAMAFGGSGLIDIATGEVLYEHRQRSRKLQFAGNIAHSVFNRDGDYLIADFTGDAVLLIDGTHDLTKTLEIPGRNVISTFSADGEVLATNGEDLKVWNTRTGALLSEIETERLSVNQQPIVSPNGRYVALFEGQESSSFLRLWDTKTGLVVSELQTSSVNAIAFHPTLDIVATAHRNTVYVWDIQTGEQLNTVSPSDFVGTFRAPLTFSHTGEYLIFTSITGTIHTWDWVTAITSSTLDAHEIGVNNIVISQDESIMLSSDFDGNLSVWDYANLELLKAISPGSAGIDEVKISPDNRMIFVLGTDGAVRVWGVVSNNP